MIIYERVGDKPFAKLCRELFDKGRAWTDANLWNGEYYEHHSQLPEGTAELSVLHGGLSLESFRLGSAVPRNFKQPGTVKAGETIRLAF